ncbi:5581_t:CDS:2 [Cetraspora pellucida]|uniref:5581_t:CDS:1 n=1 Tax=Cetraspora pellucida TaxID=1433469 RepID=A0A9N8VJL4_9GLOM|nr:5581_t:CDS:2 [Cetraspora pellucida]
MNFLKRSTTNFIYRSQLSRTFLTSLQFRNNHSEVISSWKVIISRIITKQEEILFPTPLQLLSITLNRKEIINNIPSIQTPPDETPLPPNYHLVYFNPKNYEHELSNDGYKTLYSPPAPFLRRMWAGGELKFNHKNQLRIGQKAKITTKLRDAEYKIGKLGENVFVWLDMDISNDNGWCIKDTRCLAYMPPSEDKSPRPPRKIIKENLSPEFEKVILPTSILLFRYSALTFNSHRIHYDHIHSTEIEGYPGCLVHAPLTCTLLLDLIRDNLPSSSYIKSFNYRALSPLYVDEEFKVCGKKSLTDNTSLEVWAENIQGGIAMRGTAVIGDT